MRVLITGTSRGIGYSKLPVRVGSRSEIHLIT